jgi:predicted dehydrogenase
VSPIRVGFLGVAHSHGVAKLETIHQLRQWELVGFSEEDAALRKKMEDRGFKAVERAQLIEACEVVVVESPVRDHFRDAKDVLNAGRHLHLEKPPAVNPGELEQIIELVRAKKRLLQMGYMWRYHPGINAMIEAVKRGWLGRVTHVRGQIDSLLTPATRKEVAEFKGGGMFELGCHLIDPIVRMLGKPATVSASLQHHGAENDGLADNCVAVLTFPTALATVTVNLNHGRPGPHRTLEIIGTNGTMRLQPIEPPKLVLDLVKAAGPYEAGERVLPVQAYERYRPEFLDLADAIRLRRMLPVTPEEELAVQETLLKACGMA